MAAPSPASARTDNRAPEITSLRIDPPDPIPGTAVRAEVDASDPDGDPVRIAYRWELDGRSLAETGAGLRIPTGSRPVRIAVEAVATDGLRESEPRRAEARIANRPPEVLGVAIEPGEAVDPGTVLRAVTDVQDADGDPVDLRYAWRVNDGEPVEGDVSFPTEGLRRGDHIRVEVIASDGEDDSRPLTSLPVAIGNAPPEFLSRPPAGFREGTYRYQLEARDPDGDRNLRFRLREGPEGMSVDPVLGLVRWTPTAGQSGSHVVELAVSDPQGATTAQRFELKVRAEAAEAAPPASAE